MDRRTFLHKTAHSLAGATLFAHTQPYHQLLNFNPDNDHVLVIIFLNGGNDGLNTVVPLEQMSILHKLRPHVLLPENRLLRLSDQSLAFHPSLKGFRQLYEERRLKVVRAVGYPNQNYSHFRSSDIWMTASDAHEVIPSGWLGRYLNLTYPNYPSEYPNTDHPHPLALELGFGNSLLFQGPLANMSLVINGERDYYQLVEDKPDTPPSTLAGRQLAHVKLIRRQSQVYGEVIKEANDKVGSQSPYPNTDFARQLRIVARMIAGGLRTPIYKVELGGFDTHAAQVEDGDTTAGPHANLLRELDEAVMAFLADLEQFGLADRVTGMTFSEFGRRIVSNASLGTDHGAAGPTFVFGNMVEGGVLGSDYALDADMTYEDNLQYQHDFRQVYGSVLEQWLCVSHGESTSAIEKVYEPIPIISDAACSTVAIRNQTPGSLDLSVSPNPARDFVDVSFRHAKLPLLIELISAEGRKVLSFPAPQGRIARLSLPHLPPGQYYIRVSGRKVQESRSMIKI